LKSLFLGHPVALQEKLHAAWPQMNVSKYSRNLTQEAAEEAIAFIDGRDNEINQ